MDSNRISFTRFLYLVTTDQIDAQLIDDACEVMSARASRVLYEVPHSPKKGLGPIVTSSKGSKLQVVAKQRFNLDRALEKPSSDQELKFCTLAMIAYMLWDLNPRAKMSGYSTRWHDQKPNWNQPVNSPQIDSHRMMRVDETVACYLDARLPDISSIKSIPEAKRVFPYLPVLLQKSLADELLCRLQQFCQSLNRKMDIKALIKESVFVAFDICYGFSRERVTEIIKDHLEFSECNLEIDDDISNFIQPVADAKARLTKREKSFHMGFVKKFFIDIE